MNIDAESSIEQYKQQLSETKQLLVKNNNQIDVIYLDFINLLKQSDKLKDQLLEVYPYLIQIELKKAIEKENGQQFLLILPDQVSKVLKILEEDIDKIDNDQEKNNHNVNNYVISEKVDEKQEKIPEFIDQMRHLDNQKQKDVWNKIKQIIDIVNKLEKYRNELDDQSFEFEEQDSRKICTSINQEIQNLIEENCSQSEDSATKSTNSQSDESSQDQHWYIIDSVPFCEIKEQKSIKLFKISNHNLSILINEYADELEEIFNSNQLYETHLKEEEKAYDFRKEITLKQANKLATDALRILYQQGEYQVLESLNHLQEMLAEAWEYSSPGVQMTLQAVKNMNNAIQKKVEEIINQESDLHKMQREQMEREKNKKKQQENRIIQYCETYKRFLSKISEAINNQISAFCKTNDGQT